VKRRTDDPRLVRVVDKLFSLQQTDPERFDLQMLLLRVVSDHSGGSHFEQMSMFLTEADRLYPWLDDKATGIARRWVDAADAYDREHGIRAVAS